MKHIITIFMALFFLSCSIPVSKNRVADEIKYCKDRGMDVRIKISVDDKTDELSEQKTIIFCVPKKKSELIPMSEYQIVSKMKSCRENGMDVNTIYNEEEKEVYDVICVSDSFFIDKIIREGSI